MSVVIKPFKTLGGSYVYDRNLNTFFSCDKSEYDSFCDIANGNIKPNSKLIEKYQKHGFLLDSKISEIKHPETDYLKYYTEKRLQYMTLQVTQQCNLRCAYCIL